MTKPNKPMKLQVLGLCAAMLGCAHHPGPAQPDLSQALELEAQFSSTTARAGSVVHGLFVLRNASGGPVSFCQTDGGGVSVWVQLEEGETPRPLVLHGMLSDTTCNERTTLQSGESKTFPQDFGVFHDWAGPIRILGSLRVHRVPEQQQGPGELSSSIRTPPTLLTIIPTD